MSDIIHYFYTVKESKKPEEATLRKLEKMCGKHVKMFVSFPTGFKEYEGNIEFRGSGHNFEGSDGIMELKCNMLNLVRNSEYSYIGIMVLGPSSSNH